MATNSIIEIGLRQNAAQFFLLVLINAFVGAMVGMERSILPIIAEHDFALEARAAVLSFIVVFGLTKAVMNYFAGRLSDRFGRKHVLIAGWLVAAPVPLPSYMGAKLELGSPHECAFRHKPGSQLVGNGDHESRSRGR